MKVIVENNKYEEHRLNSMGLSIRDKNFYWHVFDAGRFFPNTSLLNISSMGSSIRCEYRDFTKFNHESLIHNPNKGGLSEAISLYCTDVIQEFSNETSLVIFNLKQEDFIFEKTLNLSEFNSYEGVTEMRWLVTSEELKCKDLINEFILNLIMYNLKRRKYIAVEVELKMSLIPLKTGNMCYRVTGSTVRQSEIDAVIDKCLTSGITSITIENFDTLSQAVQNQLKLSFGKYNIMILS